MSKRLKRGLLRGSLVLIIGIGVFYFLFHSHSHESPLKVIPKNAAAVLKINVKELATKADLPKLMQEPAFKNTSSSGKISLSQLISNPFDAGIDPQENIYGFLCKEEENTVTAIVFKVSDKSDLSSFVSGLGIGTSPEEESGIYYSEIDEHRCIAWNDDAGLLMAVNGGDKKSMATKFLHQQENESILSANSYKTFSEKPFDIGLFLDNKMLSQMSGAENSLSSFGFTDGHGELLLNFEKDRISSFYTNYPETKNSTAFLKKNGFDPKNPEAITPQNPLVYFGIASDINALFSSIRTDPEMKTNLMIFESYLELSDEETRKLFDGDISIAFTDFKDISTSDPRIEAQVVEMIKQYGADIRSEFSLAVPMAYVAIGITDEEKMNSILKKSGLQKIENFYAMPGLNFIVYTCAKNGMLYITNDYYAAESFSTTGKFSTQLPSEISRTNPCILWVDLDQKHFPLALTQSVKGKYNDQTVDFFLSSIKPFKSLKMESKENGSQFDLLLNAGDGNSFYRLLSYFGSLLN